MDDRDEALGLAAMQVWEEALQDPGPASWLPGMLRWMEAQEELGCACSHFRPDRCPGAGAPCSCPCHMAIMDPN